MLGTSLSLKQVESLKKRSWNTPKNVESEIENKMWEKRTGNTHAEIKISINNINQYITHHELESKNKSVNGHLKKKIFKTFNI